MPIDFLHNHKDFSDLLKIIEDETSIQAGLIEKDYWIMHVLFGLNTLDYTFELKGGTSLSKGYGIIDRFSEDIDIHIKPPEVFQINENPKNCKPQNVEARKSFYNWLAENIKMNGISSVVRDELFDDKECYRSGGIRLLYDNKVDKVEGVKEGILLEAGFDTVTPNKKLLISSWAYDKAKRMSINIIDNRAVDIACYHPGYTFVEKLQTIATKFRQEQMKTEDEGERPNFMRQYYDVYCLLANEAVQQFIGTEEYKNHKQQRFPVRDFEIPIAKNQAFILSDFKLKDQYRDRYLKTAALYYKGQPEFDVIFQRIKENIERL